MSGRPPGTGIITIIGSALAICTATCPPLRGAVGERGRGRGRVLVITGVVLGRRAVRNCKPPSQNLIS